MIDAICALASEGLPIISVCESVGIDSATFYDWMQRGYSEDGTELQRTFSSRVTRARGAGKLRHVRHLLSAGSEDWKATAWILERTAPQEFGKREKQDITVQTKPDTSWSDIARGLGFSGESEGDA